MRKLAGWSLYLAVVAVAMLGALEAGFRIVDYQFLNPPLYPRGYHRADEQAAYDIAPDVAPVTFRFRDSTTKIWSNSLGCFDDADLPRGDYVLAIGDSITWNGYVEHDKKWTTLLQKRLGLPVLDCGVTGYTTRQELLKAKRVVQRLGHPPRLILWQYTFLNDMMEEWLYPIRGVHDGVLVSVTWATDLRNGTLERRSATEQVRRVGGPGEWLRENVVLMAVARDARDKMRRLVLGEDLRPTLPDPHLVSVLREDRYPWVKGARDAHQRTMADFIDWARSLGVPLAVLYFGDIPDIAVQRDKAGVKSGFVDADDLSGAYSDEIKAFLGAREVPVLDWSAKFVAYAGYSGPTDPRVLLSNDLLWRHDGHPNERGNRFMALHAAHFVVDQELLPVEHPTEAAADIDRELRQFVKH